MKRKKRKREKTHTMIQHIVKYVKQATKTRNPTATRARIATIAAMSVPATLAMLARYCSFRGKYQSR